ncbi:MAG: TolB family protein, partial [Planctomycetota bacterium]
GWKAGSWGHDGTILYEVIENLEQSGVYVLRPGERTATLLDWFDHEVQASPDRFWPELLPDSEHFLFVSRVDDEPCILVGSIGSRGSRVVARGESRAVYRKPGFIFYVRESQLLAQPFDERTLDTTGDPRVIAQQIEFFAPNGRSQFSVSNEGTLLYRPGQGNVPLTWFDRSGRELGAALETGPYEGFRLSPDGRELALSIRDGRSGTNDLWIVDVERNVSERLTRSDRSEWNAVWSPDGTKLVFSSDRSGPPNLFTHDFEAGTETVLVPYDDLEQYAGSWSADGRQIAYEHHDLLGDADIWLVDVDDGQRRELVSTDFTERWPNISPDGAWLAYGSFDSGRPEIYVQPLPGPGRRQRISTNAGVFPRWSRSGRELFFWDLDNYLVSVPVEADDESIRFGEPEPLFRFDQKAISIIDYDVADDGQRFLIGLGSHESQNPADEVIVGWPGLLEQ